MSRGRVVLPSSVQRAVVAHAIHDRPLECCGLLVGRGRHVLTTAPMVNRANSEVRYRVGESDHLALRKALRRLTPALEIVGVYHSHPSGAPQPSPTDIAEAFYPDWIHLIVGLGGRRPRIGAFQIRNGRVRTLAVIPEGPGGS